MENLDYEPYKEPLSRVTEGFGYMGTLAKTKDGSKVQCHVCGGLFYSLGIHAAKKHGLKEHEYRNKFDLAARTPLVSPKQREKYILAAEAVAPAVLTMRLHNLEIGRSLGSHSRKSWAKSLEHKNIEGTCPDQLIQKIQDLAAIQGRTPRLEDFRKHYGGLVGAIYSTFGGWTKALQIAGMDNASIGRKPQYNKAILIEMLKQFRATWHRRPYSSDLGTRLPSQWTFTKYFGSFSAALKEANK